MNSGQLTVTNSNSFHALRGMLSPTLRVSPRTQSVQKSIPTETVGMSRLVVGSRNWRSALTRVVEMCYIFTHDHFVSKNPQSSI